MTSSVRKSLFRFLYRGKLFQKNNTVKYPIDEKIDAGNILSINIDAVHPVKNHYGKAEATTRIRTVRSVRHFGRCHQKERGCSKKDLGKV